MSRSRGPLGPLAALAGALALALVARAALDVVEVRGRSMAPALLPGDRLVVRRTRRARVGRIVLARDPRDPARELVKRVERVEGDRIWLVGDNPAASTDGRAFGAVPASEVTWQVVARYWPPRRIGLVSRARSRSAASAPPSD